MGAFWELTLTFKVVSVCCLESYVVKVCCLGGAAANRNKKHKILVSGVLKLFYMIWDILLTNLKRTQNKTMIFGAGAFWE